MSLQAVLRAARERVSHWFAPRNIIIVSRHKVHNLNVGPLSQATLIAMTAVFFGWAAYSTGSYFAARHALKMQGQTLRSVASAKAESLNPISLLAPPLGAPAIAGSDAAEAPDASGDPLFTVSALNETRMAQRVAELEQQVNQLRNANQQIVQHVRDKTASRIDGLEDVIRQTGLDPEHLKKQMGTSKAFKAKAEGGPYIPDDLSKLVPQSRAMFSELDKLALLEHILGTLPVSKPILNASEESGFGHRTDPFTGHLALHSGIDLAGPSGSKIMATAAGKVVAAGRNGAYGNAIDVDHGFGLVTRYGHLSQILVNQGAMVKRGDVIGIQGSTGRSTGPHLHYEVRYNDKPINPKNFLLAGRYAVEE